MCKVLLTLRNGLWHKTCFIDNKAKEQSSKEDYDAKGEEKEENAFDVLPKELLSSNTYIFNYF